MEELETLDEMDSVYNADITALEEQIFNSFKERGIEVPTEEAGAISNALRAFDYDLTDDLGVVDVYYKDDVKSFEEATTIRNVYDVQIAADKASEGVFYRTYTMIPNVTYSMSEHVRLMYNDDAIADLADYDSEHPSKVINENEWCVTVIEEVRWENSVYRMIPRLFIYCPFKDTMEDSF